jgi:anti-sigma factor RsiW
MSGPHRDGGADRSCADFESLIVRAADGVLDPVDRLRLDGHLAGCASCRVALDDQRTLASLVAAAFDSRPVPGFTTRVLAHLKPTESWLDRLDFRRWTWWVSPVAAGLALAAWLVASSTSTAIALEPAADVAVDPAQIQVVSWADAVTEGDLVSLIWQAEVGTDAAPATQEIAQ